MAMPGPARKATRKPPRKGTPRRRPGRPAAGAPGDDPRAALLDAALDLFARQGVTATTLQAVADAAGVTPAMLHYYFGSRDRLLDVLVEERLVPLLADVLKDAVGDAGLAEPRRLLATLVPRVMGTAAANPWLPPLWVREVLTDGGVLRERVLVHTRTVVPLLAAHFRRAQQAGNLNPDLDPRLLLVSLIGLTLFPFAAAPIWRSVLDARDITADTLINHTLALLTRGLELPR